MKLSTKGRYGVKALFELAMHEGAGPMSLKAIAERQGLSEHYLEQLAGPLRRAGLIASVRGAQGGYVLARPAAQISVGDVLRVLEGSAEDQDETPQERERRAAGLKSAWDRVKDGIVQYVDSITLASLVEEAKSEQSRQNMVYHI